VKLVTFAKDMAPHGVGDTRLVSDGVATDLERDKAISASEPWPPSSDTAPAAQKPNRPTLKPTRATGGHDQRKAQ
jgi:hypothetical protein